MGISKVLKIVSLLAFVLAVFQVNLPFDLVATGLAFWVGSELV